MKHLLSIIVLALLGFTNTNAYEKRDLLQHSASEEQLKQYLVMDQKWVPYPNYIDRQGWDELTSDNRNAIIKAGERFLDNAWTVVRASDYMEYERSGSRKAMEDPYNKNTQAFSALLMAELAEGKGRFVNDIVNGVFSLCEMTSWAESAHLASYQKTKRALPDHNENILDLKSGNLSQLLSWTYYFLHNEFDKVDPIISQRLHYELYRREINPYLERSDFWWMAFNYRSGMMVNNWNPWCNSNALLCFMLLENDRDRLAKAVYRTMTSVDQYLNYVKEDGGCEEGPSYWGHSPGKLYEYLSVLSMATGGKVSLFNQKTIRDMGEYMALSYVGNEWVVNFADASAKAGEVYTPLIFRYGVAVNSEVMRSMAVDRESKYPTKLQNNWLDLFRGLETLRFAPMMEKAKGNFKAPAFTWYPQTQFCYMRDKGAFLATKGGNNNESHNHNDVGTCTLYFDNMPILIDAGVGTYTRQTFSNERYSIWTMQSQYHNLPVINGIQQKFGAEYKASNVKATKSKDSFSADISTAYPEEAKVRSWVRSYKLDNDKLMVSDNFRLTQCKTPHRINFLSWGDIDISHSGEVRINVQGVKSKLKYDSKKFVASIEDINLTDVRLSKVWGPVIRRITLTAKTTDTAGEYRYIISKEK